MSESVIVALLAGLFGAGGIGAIYKAWADHQAGRRQADHDDDKATIEGFELLVNNLASQVDRLTEKIERQDTRIGRLEEAVEEERDLKWQAIQYARSLLVWISRHAPGKRPPDAPMILATHFVVPEEEE